jgi:hypothetical protein
MVVMAVYVDKLTPCVPSKKWRWAQSCHLFADTVDELHAFAAHIGLRRAWFQDHPRLPHYDLHPTRRLRAVALGAIQVGRKEVVEHMRKLQQVRVEANLRGELQKHVGKRDTWPRRNAMAARASAVLLDELAEEGDREDTTASSRGVRT